MYKYGMKERGYSIGCQPSGVIDCENFSNKSNGYWSYIYYKEKLNDEQVRRYELDYLGEVK